jgi:hypothetical protein
MLGSNWTKIKCTIHEDLLHVIPSWLLIGLKESLRQQMQRESRKTVDAEYKNIYHFFENRALSWITKRNRAVPQNP